MADDITTPQLKVPFQMSGSKMATIEQDSDDDVVQCVAATIRTRPGTRPDDPLMGIPDFAFSENGADLSVIRATLAKYEPRATVMTEQELVDLIATVTVGVETTEEETFTNG